MEDNISGKSGDQRKKPQKSTLRSLIERGWPEDEDHGTYCDKFGIEQSLRNDRLRERCEERNGDSLRFWKGFQDKARQEEMAETRRKSHGDRPKHVAQQLVGGTRGPPVFELESPGGGSQPSESLRLRRREDAVKDGSNINWSCSLPFHSRPERREEG